MHLLALLQDGPYGERKSKRRLRSPGTRGWHPGGRGAYGLRGQGAQGGPKVQRCRVVQNGADDRPRRRGTGGGLSRSAKQFVSDYTEKGSISPERPGCFHGENQAE